MIDTHAHLQFKAFEGNVDEVIKRANEAGVSKIIVIGTNLETSEKAIELAEKHQGLYASVGIHPHHVFSYNISPPNPSSLRGVSFKRDDAAISYIKSLEELISNPKVIAIGETGLDRHIYENTKYKDYEISDEFINLQKLFFKEQIKLAIKYQKSLIIHNRQAVSELLQVLEENWDPFLEGRSVFHCCEPEQKLLDFALKHNVFIGIDGDITYDKDKQEFIKQVPLERVVLETDSPYFIPEPLKSRHSREGGNPINNEPKNLNIVSKFIASLLRVNIEQLKHQTLKNSLNLLNLTQI